MLISCSDRDQDHHAKKLEIILTELLNFNTKKDEIPHTLKMKIIGKSNHCSSAII